MPRNGLNEDLNANQSSPGISRRRAIKAIGGTAVAGGLAGCGGDQEGDGTPGGDENGNGDSDQELGERVPTLVMTYWSDLGFQSRIHENASPIIKENLEEGLGVSVEIRPQNFTSNLTTVLGDERETQIPLFRWTPSPSRLDPQFLTMVHNATWAGAGGEANHINYADCEFTDLAMAQATATSVEERREIVNEAHSILSNDKAVIPFANSQLLGAARTDEVNVDGVGSAGIHLNNEWAYIKSEAKDRDRLIANIPPAYIETSNFHTISGVDPLWMWNHFVHSPLVSYDENLELVNVLADDYEVSDGGQTFTVSLKDATFHNGDPITAEDVQFTFEYIDNNAEVFPQASSIGFTSIEVVDDKTARFNFDEPFLPLTTRVWAAWGILHKDTWVEGGAPDDPEGFTFDPMIGSGPFEATDFEAGTNLTLEPHDGSPIETPGSGLFFQGFREAQTIFEAFSNNELQIIFGLTPSLAARARDELSDVARVGPSRGHSPGIMISPQCNIAPTKFEPFRDAVGKAVDRREINQIAYKGTSRTTTFAEIMLDPHPWRPPEDMLYQFTDDPTGDLDAAQQALEDAGWGIDDQGNLRYPADADLNPLWPDGEVPTSEDGFACLDSEGEWIPPGER